MEGQERTVNGFKKMTPENILEPEHKLPIFPLKLFDVGKHPIQPAPPPMMFQSKVYHPPPVITAQPRPPIQPLGPLKINPGASVEPCRPFLPRMDHPCYVQQAHPGLEDRAYVSADRGHLSADRGHLSAEKGHLGAVIKPLPLAMTEQPCSILSPQPRPPLTIPMEDFGGLFQDTPRSPRSLKITGFTPRTGQAIDLQRREPSDSQILPDPGEIEEYLFGLDDLARTSYIHVQQQKPMDIQAGCGSGNTYHIRNKLGKQLFYGAEEENCFCRSVCGPNRMTHLTLLNNHDEPVLHFDRECCRCDCCCCFPCYLCQHTLVVRDGQEEILGYVRQKVPLFYPRLDVTDADNQRYTSIIGPCCPNRCCTQINFDIINCKDGQLAGYVLKKYMEGTEGTNMDHENFILSMPPNLTVKQKSVLLGAAFLVNFMYFEMS